MEPDRRQRSEDMYVAERGTEKTCLTQLTNIHTLKICIHYNKWVLAALRACALCAPVSLGSLIRKPERCYAALLTLY